MALPALLAIHCSSELERPAARCSPMSESVDGGIRTRDSDGPPRVIDRATYRDRLEALWLAESVANWTGLVTEGARVRAPFFTDADWGSLQGNASIQGSEAGSIDFNFLDPWPSDDDTDIEFIYVAAMRDLGCAQLDPVQIQRHWLKHTEPGEYIWASNRVAQGLMEQAPSVLPPSTSLLAANDQALMVDAQLTTEVFGALAPGMPVTALELADLPIRVTATAFAAHAAQFYVVLYSLAGIVEPDLSGAEKVEWLVENARRILPEGSKAADIIDFVLEDYTANPDRDDWERTRDMVAVRFQSDAEAHGYRFLEWYESSVNLATGLIALLYGANDLRRTIQIGALSGWDSDNGTATMGGLLGLVNGTEYVLEAFPGQQLSRDYYIGRTRIAFESDTTTFGDIADDMLDLVDQVISDAGGSEVDGRYTLPSTDLTALEPSVNPRVIEHARSVNNRVGSSATVRVEGGVAKSPGGTGLASDDVVADGLEFDESGKDRMLSVRDGSEFPDGPSQPRCIARSGSEPVTITVAWALASELVGARVVEGSSTSTGGWLQGLTVEVRDGGAWHTVELREAYEPGIDVAFEIHRLVFEAPVMADGLRISGKPGGSENYFTLCEVDGLRKAAAH